MCQISKDIGRDLLLSLNVAVEVPYGDQRFVIFETNPMVFFVIM